MNLNATQPHESAPNAADGAAGPSTIEPPLAGGARFTYASGSRPLAGYTIKRGIGHGGFGEVYFATSDAGKEVAIKLIRRNLDIELRGVMHCLNLKHPNLLSLYDVRQDDQGDTWVVMELMSGNSLEDLLAKYPNGLPVGEALAWIHGIAAGVAYLHDHGIVHRDLKPGNIFIDEGIVKIGDYGLSKFISCSRRSGQTGSVGTVHYMAPEIANGRYGKEIDIYALGIILYEMLTGHVPFEGESVGEILMKHLTAEPNVSTLAEPYRTIVARCLAKDPAKRFDSVSEMIALLPPVPSGTAAAAGKFAGPNPSALASFPPPLPQGGAAAGPQAAAAPNAGASTGFSLGDRVRQAGQQANAGQPAADWVNDAKKDAVDWWERRNFHLWQKLVILLLGIWIAVLVFDALGHSTRLGFPSLLIIGLVAYAIFRTHERRKRERAGKPYGRSWPPTSPRPVAPVAPPQGAGPLGTAANAAASVPPQVRAPLRESPTRRRWRSGGVAPAYQPGPPRQRVTELVGSLLFSAVICLVLGLVVLILRGNAPDANQYAWVALTSIVGSWCVLIASKFWEGASGDVAVRRFVMLVLGLCVGAVAYGLSVWLYLPLHADPNFHYGISQNFTEQFFAADGSPLFFAFLAYFGALFLIPKWWRRADPVRSTRLSIWHTVLAIACSWIITVFWPFPQPWGLMTTATMAIAIQMASPWVSPIDRAKFAAPTAGG